MRTGFRQSMAWLHAWSGLVVGWVMFAIFVTGTATYYREDISRWMRPEIRVAEVDAGPAAERAAAFLREKAPDAMGWYIGLPKEGTPLVNVMWWKSFEGPFHSAILDAESGAPTTARATQGGDFLYRFHFELSMGPVWGRYLVGICAMILLVSLVSGIVTHRRIFADFFTFRRAKSAQRSWLDAHNVGGVLALPFHLMIVYSGLVTLATMYMPWGVHIAYHGDEPRFFVEAGLVPDYRPAAGRPGTLVPLGPLVAHAAARMPGPPEGISVNNPGDAAATVVVAGEEPHGLAHLHPQVSFDGATGAVLGAVAGEARPAVRTSAVLVGLHEGHFAGPVLRLLFLLCGLMGAATVATGLVLWTVARVPKAGEAAGFGLRLVRVLNVGTVAGLPIGLAAYLLANRLLPLGLDERAAWEVRAFFGAWALAALVGALRPYAGVWREGLGLAGLLFLAVPVVSALTVHHALAEEGRFLGFDAAMLLVGLALLASAWKAGQARVSRMRAGYAARVSAEGLRQA